MDRLIADIGGTNARFALVGPDGRPHHEQQLLVADFPGPVEAARAYLARQLKDRPSVRGEAALIDLTLAEGADPTATLNDLKHITDQLLVRNPSYRCNRCGFGARAHHWQCPSCKEWGSIKPLLRSFGAE